MSDTIIRVDPALLRQLIPMNGMGETHREEIAARAEMLSLAAGESLNVQGQASELTLYLVEGAVELAGESGATQRMDASNELARLPLSQLVKGLITTTATEAARIVRVDRAQVSTLLILAQSARAIDDAPQHDTPSGDWSAKLLRSALFARIPPVNVQRIFSLMEAVPAAEDETIIRQGELGDYYYVVREGTCAVWHDAGDGNTSVRVAELKAGDGFGEEALVSEARRNASVVMNSAGVLMRMTKEDFIELIHEPLLDRVNLNQAKTLISEGGRWLDVRLEDEYRANGIENSLNVPLSALRDSIAEHDPGKGFVVYCNSGRRSAAAAFLLAQRGIASWMLDGGLLHAESDAGEADPQSLQNRLLIANAEFEAALREKAEVDAERVVDASADAEQDTHRETGAETTLDATSAGLESDSDQAAERLDAAQKQKLELEAEMRATEARAKGDRLRMQESIKHMREEADARLREEESRLKSEYAQAAGELNRIQNAQRDAQERFDAERKKLETELAQARSRMKSEAQRIKGELEASKREAELNAANIRTEQSDRERRVRDAMETRLRAERQRLESQFALSVARQQRAQHDLEMAESAKLAAQAESERLAAQLAAEEQNRLAIAQARQAQEQLELEEREAQAALALREALAAREEAAESHRDLSATVINIKAEHRREEAKVEQGAAALRAELTESEAKLAEADQRIEAAELARIEAEKAQHRVESRLAHQELAEEELRYKLVEEAQGWLENEKAQSDTELAQLNEVEADIARLAAEKAESKRRADAANNDMMADILSQLGDEADDSGDDPTARNIGMRTTIEEHAALTHAAQEEAAEKKARAQIAIEQARKRIAALNRD